MLSTNWLNSSDIDSMLELLCEQVQESTTERTRFIVFSTHLVQKLLTTFGDQTQGISYEACSWLQNIGKEVFEQGKTLITVTHLGKLPPKKGMKKGSDHWVPLVIDGREHSFIYGDSLVGKKMPVIPDRLLNALNAWRERHTFSTFTCTTLPTSQQEDTHSCGIRATNALEHYVRPMQFALLGPHQHHVASAKLQAVNRISIGVKTLYVIFGSDDNSLTSCRLATVKNVPLKHQRHQRSQTLRMAVTVEHHQRHSRNWH